MLDPKVRIIGTTERAVFNDQGRMMEQIRVAWMYGPDHGPFYEYMPKEGWTIAAFEERVAPHLNELRRLQP